VLPAPLVRFRPCFRGFGLMGHSVGTLRPGFVSMVFSGLAPLVIEDAAEEGELISVRGRTPDEPVAYPEPPPPEELTWHGLSDAQPEAGSPADTGGRANEPVLTVSGPAPPINISLAAGNTGPAQGGLQPAVSRGRRCGPARPLIRRLVKGSCAGRSRMRIFCREGRGRLSASARKACHDWKVAPRT
jgi:hypothetical protein